MSQSSDSKSDVPDDSAKAPPEKNGWLETIRFVTWPLLIFLLAFMFRGPLTDILTSSGKDTTLELSPTSVKIITKNIVGATKEYQDKGALIPAGAQQRAASAASDAAKNVDLLKTRSVLWIDDEPGNNTLLQNAFTETGVKVFNALSTDEAKTLLAQRSFDLAITDVKRNFEGPTAGLNILPELKNRQIPTIVFSGSWSGQHRGQEATYGVIQITNDPSEVYSVGIASLSKQ